MMLMNVYYSSFKFVEIWVRIKCIIHIDITSRFIL